MAGPLSWFTVSLVNAECGADSAEWLGSTGRGHTWGADRQRTDWAPRSRPILASHGIPADPPPPRPGAPLKAGHQGMAWPLTSMSMMWAGRAELFHELWN